MKNNIIKLIMIIILFATMIQTNSIVFAAEVTGTTADDRIVIDPTKPSIDTSYWKPNDATLDSKVMNMVNTVIKIIRTVGSIISVAMLIIIGIKYMFGSIEERVEMKNTMMTYVIGATLLFAITNLLSIIYDIVIQF